MNTFDRLDYINFRLRSLNSMNNTLMLEIEDKMYFFHQGKRVRIKFSQGARMSLMHELKNNLTETIELTIEKIELTHCD